MLAPCTSSASVHKINSIEVIDEEIDLVDITVEGNHTFWISSDANRWTLTHNSGAPDIDVDVANRDLVLDVLRTEFGFNNVVPISNVNSFKVKSLVKDLSKFYGIPFDEANAALRTVDQDVRKATQKHGDDKNLFVLTYEDSLKYSPTFKAFIDKHPEISESINILFKEQRSLGRHAGGVVIMDDAPAQLPLITNKGEPQTPWVEGVGGKYLEPVGAIKYDLLGLETMRLIEKTGSRIINKRGLYDIVINGITYHLFGDDNVKLTDGSVKAASELTMDDDVDDNALATDHADRVKKGLRETCMAKVESITKVKASFPDIREWYENTLHPDVNDYDDPDVYKYVYEEGRFPAVFQCTGKGAQRLFMKAKPTSINDIAVLTSIYRPGPLAAKVDDIYLKAKEGKKFDWGHPIFEKVLGKTYNCLAGDVDVFTENGPIRISVLKEMFDQGETLPKLPSFNEETNDIEQDEIVAAVCNGVRDLLEIEMEDGRSIKVTEDHLMMTDRGWVRAIELTLEDKILQANDYRYLSGEFLKDEESLRNL